LSSRAAGIRAASNLQFGSEGRPPADQDSRPDRRGRPLHGIKWTGLPVTWELMFGGLALIVTVVTHPEGVASVLQAAGRRLSGTIASRLGRSTPATSAVRVDAENL
jgi:hypothetical protein